MKRRGGLGRFVREIERRFNLSYLKYRLVEERREIAKYLAQRSPPPGLKFSILIPLYGIPLQDVKECLDSIARQTYTNWEVCFCNDCDPTSGIMDLVKEFADQYPTKVLWTQHATNKGISAATRSALKLSSGEYCVFLDADDRLHRRALEIFARAIGPSELPDMVYSDHDYMSDWSYRIRPVRKPIWSPELLLSYNYINHLKVVKTKFLLEIEEKILSDQVNGVQDWDVCLNVNRFAKRVVHVPLVLYHWRQREGSVAKRPNAKPWLFDAQKRLRSKYIETLHSTLAFDPNTNEVAFKDGHCPKMHILDLSDLKQEVNDKREIHQFLLAIQDRLSHSNECDSSIICISTESPPARSQMEALAAYAVMPRVGAVWGFRKPHTRLAYTLDQEEQKFRPLNHPRGSFSRSTGNVLTGPLHSLVIQMDRLKDALQFLLACRNETAVALKDLDQIGALIGLANIHLGRRNVSTKLAQIPYMPSPIPIPLSPLVPSFDPYI